MSGTPTSRRNFLKLAGTVAGSGLLHPAFEVDHSPTHEAQLPVPPDPTPADYTLRIGAAPIELAPKHIVSTITYNGQFPGPLLRFKEGHPVTVEVHNDTDTPELVHWHGMFISTKADGAEEEGSPFVAPHGHQRVKFTPTPSGSRSDRGAARSVPSSSYVHAWYGRCRVSRFPAPPARIIPRS